MKWFYVEGKTQVGPITEKDLERLIEEGNLIESSLVRRADWKDWIRLIDTGLVEFESEEAVVEDPKPVAKPEQKPVAEPPKKTAKREGRRAESYS